MQWKLLILVFITAIGSSATPQEQKIQVEKPTQRVKVEFFVMSLCPFAAQVEDTFALVTDRLSGSINFSLEFVGTESGGQLSSLHGEREIRGNLVEICAAKYHPDKLMPLLSCLNQDLRMIPDNWQECAQRIGVPLEGIQSCQQSEEGQMLLRASFERSRQRRILGSPTIFISGKPYKGSRSVVSFTREICNALTEHQPEACSQLSQPVVVPITLLTDSRCQDCRTEQITTGMENLFPESKIQQVDYITPEGKKMYSELELKLLPVLLFGKEVIQSDNYERLSQYLQPHGKVLIFQVGAFDPTREICENGVDDDADGQIDCKDPDCVHALSCREEFSQKLEMFIMSQCPFAVRALDSMKEVLKRFGSKIRFEIHYIAKAQGEGFSSLHGQDEVDENIRQLCAIKHYATNHKFMDYIWCRNLDIRSTEWRSCTGKNGISTTVIEKCVTSGEGRKLLQEDINIAEGLKISASPSWLVNNRYSFMGLDPDVIMREFCGHNPNAPGCQGIENLKPPAEKPLDVDCQ